MKIAFTDFWPDFQERNNFFLHLFREILDEGLVEVTHPSQSDVLIYSCFGEPEFGGSGAEHRLYDKNKIIKIFYTGENIRPNFNDCTYSFTFDFDDYEGRNVRIPLWLMQLDWYNKVDYRNPKYVVPLDHIERNELMETPKTKFCAFINNRLYDNRVECFDKLSQYKKVDGYGEPFKNWFYGEKDKMTILSNYKFSLCFENSLAPEGGYFTEKLVHSKLSGNIPIYWADERIKEDFNTKSFLNLNDYKSIDELVERVVEIDQDENLYKSIHEEPLFNEFTDPYKKKKQIAEDVKRLLGL